MNVELAHAGEGVEGCEEVVSEVHCGHIGRPWEFSTRNPVDSLSRSLNILTQFATSCIMGDGR
jgi:hypothetical protein